MFNLSGHCTKGRDHAYLRLLLDQHLFLQGKLKKPKLSVNTNYITILSANWRDCGSYTHGFYCNIDRVD